MGEAAEWEIWRKHGVDISDTGYLENPPKRRRVAAKGTNQQQRSKQMGDGWQHKDDVPDGYYNADRGSYEPVWDGPTQRHPQPKKPLRSNYTMNTKEAITLIQLSQGARIVAATYESGPNKQQYHFKNVVGLKLEVGDRVIVQSSGPSHNGGFALVTVANPDVLPTDCGCALDKLKHVVTKLDTSALDRVEQSERQAVHRLAMSEVTDRLATYRSQLGGSGFAEVESLLAPAPQPAGAWGSREDVRRYTSIDENGEVIDEGDKR